MQKNVIFRDSDIVEFCRTTRDINEVHDPEYMRSIGKRAIVPGMFALSATANLSADFLKKSACTIKVFFNTLLSSGDFATLCAEPNLLDPSEMRLLAINHKDTLTSKEEYTRIISGAGITGFQTCGVVQKLDICEDQFSTFLRLIGAKDLEMARVLFAVSYASNALFRQIDVAQTEIESEIDQLINHHSKVSPFYHTLEIKIPSPFPTIHPQGTLDYRIHFERVKKNKAYFAYVQCEQEGNVIYNSQYNLVAIPDIIILRMAKEIP